MADVHSCNTDVYERRDIEIKRMGFHR